MLPFILQMGIDMAGQHGILTIGTHHNALDGEIDEQIHIAHANQTHWIL
jgi:hypothetical protein